MSYRAGVILLQEDKVALIERHRAGLHYYTFPGGHVDEGETPEQYSCPRDPGGTWSASDAEAIDRPIRWQGKWQYYYLVEVTGGAFGSGKGEELFDPVHQRGTYRPMWMPVSEILTSP